RNNFIGCDFLRARSPISGNVLGSALDRFNERAAFARALCGQRYLRDRFINKESGRHKTCGARGLNASEFTIELLWIRLQPSDISLGVGGVLDGMIAVEESRDVEVCADVLNHDIWRVAPAAYRYVAVEQRESFNGLPIRAANHFEARPRRMR